MKKMFALILALAMCLSLCACGSRDIASPGTEDKETSDDAGNNNADNAENSEIASDGDNANVVSGDSNANADSDSSVSNDSENANDSNSESNIPSSGNNTPGAVAEAPESTEEYQFVSGGASIDISYSNDMNVYEIGDGRVCVAYDQCKLYVQNVTSEFNPDSDEPATFLYDYAYEKCVGMVVDAYGEITQFEGEYNLAPEGNEIYGYGANMTCNSQTQVYTFIKLLTLDNGEGYAVMIGVCDEYNASVFDNIEVQ